MTISRGHSGDRKARNTARILEAAEFCLAKNGGDLRLKDVAARANASTATILKYFKDKEGLLAALLARAAERRTEVMLGLPDDPVEAGAALARVWADDIYPVIRGVLGSPHPQLIVGPRYGEDHALGRAYFERAGFPVDLVEPWLGAIVWPTIMERAIAGRVSDARAREIAENAAKMFRA